jgi:hypothetical protein
MYDRAHYLLSFGGSLLNGLEEWQTGLRFAPNTGHTEADLLDALGQISVSDIFDDFAAVISTPDTTIQYHQSVVMRFAKLAVIKPDGKYAGEPKIAEGNVTGTWSLSAPGVPQLAWVATLGTGHKFGMAQKGRMYWPCPVTVPGTISSTTGQIPPAHCAAFRDLIATAITAAEGEVSTTLVPAFAAVLSKSGGVTAPQAPGTTNPITEVSVGNVIDTQRRRRGELQEMYVPVPAARGLRASLTAEPGRRSATW